jgi:hypothetical protein
MTTRVAVSVNGEGSTPEGESFTASCALTFDDEPSSIQGADAIENCVGCIIGACRRIVAEELMKEEKAQSSIGSKRESKGVQSIQ